MYLPLLPHSLEGRRLIVTASLLGFNIMLGWAFLLRLVFFTVFHLDRYVPIEIREFNLPTMFLGYFALGLVLAVLFPLLRRKHSFILNGLRFGGLMGCVGGGLGILVVGMSGHGSINTAVLNSAWQMFLEILGGIAVAFVYTFQPHSS